MTRARDLLASIACGIIAGLAVVAVILIVSPCQLPLQRGAVSGGGDSMIPWAPYLIAGALTFAIAVVGVVAIILVMWVTFAVLENWFGD